MKDFTSCPQRLSAHAVSFRALVATIAILIQALLTGLTVRAETPALVPTYSQVHAVFAQRCLSCHDAKEAESDFVMETYASLMKGGEKGADILPGNANDSRLFQEITHQVKPFMPPPKKAPSLPAEEIALIRAWINGSSAHGPEANEVAAQGSPTTRPIAKILPKITSRRPVMSLAYDVQSKMVAVARPGEVEVWSVEQQGVIHRFSNLGSDVNAVVFSADGKRLFAAGGEPGVAGRVWIWNVSDWTVVTTLDGHKDAIYALSISSDGKLLATGSYDQAILLWEIDGKNPPRSLHGHNGAVFGVAFRPDNRVLASVSADRTLKLWDVKSGARLDTRPESFKDLYTVAWSPDGTRVAAAGVDNRIRIWKVSPAALEGENVIEQTKFAHDGAVLRIAWSPDGKYILSGADNDTLRLFTAADMKQKLTFSPQSDWPSALTFAEGSSIAIIGRLDGSVGFYETTGGHEIAPPLPVLTGVSPRGIERGKVARVKLTGKNLAGANQVILAEAMDRHITAKLLADPKSTEAWIEITTPADAALTPFSVSVKGAAGASAAIKLFVDNLPQLSKESMHPPHPQILPTPSSIWSTFMPAGAVDHFAVEAKKGQTVVFDVAAKRFGSKAQVELSVSDSSGRILATAGAAGDDADPLLAFTAPADGQFEIRVSDLTTGGTADNFYRLSVGDFAYVTGTFPLAGTVDADTRVQLIGHNLPADAYVTVKPKVAGTDVDVPVNAEHFRSRRPLKIVASSMPELIEVEPNDTPKQAMLIPVPSSVNGRIGAAGDVDLYRFTAKAGSTYAIETLAAQRGSPVDTRIQVLDPDGRLVQRLQLRAVRDSNITFRGFDANDGGARFPNYLEMDLDQYVYINGEVVRLFNYPQGPDSNFFFYLLNGKRRCYFGTTATGHALDEKCYVVEPHGVGEKLLPNGLPVIPLYYENDDDPDRLAGSDSRLLFTAPADGDYLVRVTDTRNFGGSDYVYRLTVRPAQPDFTATITGYDPAPPAGAGREFTVKLDRLDGFDGTVQVDITNVPAGFSISTPIVVEAGQWEALGTLYALPDAQRSSASAPLDGLKVTATAVVDGKTVVRAMPDLKRPAAAPKAAVTLSLEPAETTEAPYNPANPKPIILTPGKLTPAWLRASRNGFTKALSFDARNLPHGVIVADIGLNGVQLLEGQSERQIFIQCAPWVAPTKRPGCMRIRELANLTTPPVPIIIRGAAGSENASR